MPAAESEITQGSATVRGVLKLSVPASFGKLHLAPTHRDAAPVGAGRYLKQHQRDSAVSAYPTQRYGPTLTAMPKVTNACG
jgi:hypothetical protein